MQDPSLRGSCPSAAGNGVFSVPADMTHNPLETPDYITMRTFSFTLGALLILLLAKIGYNHGPRPVRIKLSSKTNYIQNRRFTTNVPVILLYIAYLSVII